MISWLQTNIGSIVVVLFLLGMVALIVRRLILDKKAGKHICGGSCGSCGGSCSGCPMQGRCHGK
ncbi:MAG: FeoB-associated Cys-rich membrane protein [Ruminococcaceae bacterium]|nr:FeoB-associated Cys-rich membrane protein [Oscillospiraceae bacterium]